MSLKQKTISGVLWSGVEKFATLFIQLISTLIIARVLSPEDFGLIGMLTIFLGVAQVILDSGFGQALMRKKDATDIDYSSVFYVNLVLGILLYIILYCSSPFIASFYNIPGLELIAKIAFIVIPINALGLIQFTLLNKNIDFKTLSKLTIISAFVSGVIGIVIAIYYRNVWSLVIQSLSFYFLRTLLLWFFSPWKPLAKFSLNSIREMFSFSINLLFSGLIGSVFNNLYFLVVGKFYSPIELGYYSQADRFQKIPSTSITDVIQRVTFPILVLVQDDNDRLKDAYIKIIGIAFFIVAPIMMFLMIISENLFDLLLTSKWHKASIYFKFLCIVGALYPLSSINLNILNIKGKGKLILILESVRKIILCLILFLTFKYSMTVLMYGLVVYSFCQLVLNSYFSGKQIRLTLKMQFLDLLPTLLSLCLAMTFTVTLNVLSKNIHSLILILMQLVVFLFTYIFISSWLKIKAFTETVLILKSQINLLKVRFF
jgi:teichuronic acid exporter